MGRRLIDPGSNGSRRSFWILLFVIFLSCSLAYMVFSVTARRSSGDPSFSAMGSRLTSDTESESEANCCRGLEHLELWGDAVKWGTNHRVNSPKECCEACKAMCKEKDGPCLCDSWVFCGDRERCGEKFGECWLKKQKDVLFPALAGSGENVMWTSGRNFGVVDGIVGLETSYGTLRIKLLPDCAPHSVAYITELLSSRHCAGCQIYRAEGRGPFWDPEGSHIPNAPFGSPYALLQGTLEADGTPFKKIPVEACPTIKRGSIAWVGSGPEFFISLADHSEWRKAYTVFGSLLLEDLEIAEKIASLPTKSDVWGNVNVLLLENPIHFRLKRITNIRKTNTSTAATKS
ncbi:uncharacterized protein [Typha latifolia]|uniref:uncharacterized protein isoform X1 n=1 Tax=Typha latifolia TaxID=4733 RepID=UPI003C2F7F1F